MCCVLALTLLVIAVLASAIARRHARRLLENCGLPTILRRPRFVTYTPNEERHGQVMSQKPPSSFITGILPRMERLGGPFGMYGVVYGISTPLVHVAHPTPARNILAGAIPPQDRRKRRRSSIVDSSGATKSPLYNQFKIFSGNGVFNVDGNEWKEKRASVIHCLLRGISSPNTEASRRLELEANAAADMVISGIQAEHNGQQDKAATGAIAIDVVPILQKATIGFIYRVLTHDDDQSFGGSGYQQSKSRSSWSLSNGPAVRSPPEICSPILLRSYLASVNDMRMYIPAQSRSIWFLLPQWVNRAYRAFSATHRVEEQIMAPIQTFATRACDRAKLDSPLAMLRDRPSHSQYCKEKGSLPKALLDEAITLLFAGQDTSAATLSWTLHLLSLHLDVQTRLAEEIRAVVDSEQGAEICDLPIMTKKNVTQMPLLDAVIKESMRLYPVAPLVMRKLTHDVHVMEDEQVTVLPAGAFACIWIYGLHRNKTFWHRPDDFVPDRWMDPKLRTLDAGQEVPGAYMPFAAGPRNCVGQPLAHVVLRIMLARIISQYEFRDKGLTQGGDSSKLRKDMTAGFTVLPSGGLALSARDRAKTR